MGLHIRLDNQQHGGSLGRICYLGTGRLPLRLQELAVNGDDLQHLGITPGPRLGQILQTLLSHVLDAPAENTRTCLLALAQTERDRPHHSGAG